MGIICGAGFYELAILISVFVTIGLFVFQIVPAQESPFLVVISADSADAEEAILAEIKKHSPMYRVDSKNLSQSGMDMIVETRAKKGSEIVNNVKAIDGVRSVSYIYHENGVKN